MGIVSKSSHRRRVWVVLLVAFGLLAGAGIASAADGDPDDDTQLNFAYDQDNHIFMVNTSATDSPYDCRLGAEEGQTRVLDVQYGDVSDRWVPVDMLLEGAAPVVFPNRDAADVGSDFDPADEPVQYSGPEGECAVSGGQVGGPNGQINHGQFMKLFHEMVDMKGHGCLNRIIAQSDLGKDDQQLRTSDVEDGFTPQSEGTVEFTTETADCEHGKKDKGEDGAGVEAEAKKDKGRPDSPGNSGNAPGKNK
jgi:hypothetical protein